MRQISPFRARKGDDDFTPTQIPASKGDDGFIQPHHLSCSAQRRRPWAAAGLGRATGGRTTLQTSSNRRNLKRLPRTSVTNVVNLRPKTLIFSEKAVGLTTFVTTDQKSTRKTPWIDDVCNNTHQSTPKTQHARPPSRPQRAAGPGGGARGRRRGLAGQRDNAPCHASATRPHWCGGRRRNLPRCRWAVAGPGRASRRRAEPHISDQAPLVWRAPEGPEGTGGLRGAAPNEVRPPSLAGGRGLRRPEHPWDPKQPSPVP